MLEKVEGIIIRTQDYGETHVIATMMTDKLGKIGVIARGAKKPKSRMSAIAQMFIHGQYLVRTGKGLGVLEQGEIIDSHRRIREDIFLTAYASYIAELTNILLDEKRPNYYVYQQFLATLEGFIGKKDPVVLSIIYELKLYRIAGFAPTLDLCQNCQELNRLEAFSIKEAGVLCYKCLSVDPNHIRLTQTQIKLLQLFLEVGVDQVANISVKDENKLMITKILEQYYDSYGGFRLKSRKFLKQLDQLR